MVSVPCRGSMSFYRVIETYIDGRNVSVPCRGSMSFYQYTFECCAHINHVSVPCRGSMSFYPVAWIAFIAMLFHWICGGKEKYRKSMKKLLFKLL